LIDLLNHFAVIDRIVRTVYFGDVLGIHIYAVIPSFPRHATGRPVINSNQLHDLLHFRFQSAWWSTEASRPWKTSPNHVGSDTLLWSSDAACPLGIFSCPLSLIHFGAVAAPRLNWIDYIPLWDYSGFADFDLSDDFIMIFDSHSGGEDVSPAEPCRQ
jgi:hypothetical protein